MSTSKHIDKICIAAVCLMLVLTILFVNGGSLGVSVIANAMKYESTLFDTSYVHKIDIVMNDWDSFIENCENEEYTSCTVVIDGNQHKNIAIRAKGNTSLSSVKSLDSQRYSFKLEFDHYEDGKNCDGLDKLCLNNLIQDNTMMKDYIAYILMNDFGVDSPLCSFAYITVNGEDWGLYLAVEGIEDSFLQRNYGSDSGELYKPDSMSFGGGRGNGKDFDMVDFELGSSASKPFDGEMPQMPNDSARPMPEGEFDGEMPSMPNGFGSMGNADVKLQYIDDDSDSYANIFDNAKTDVSKADQKRLISALKNLSEYTDLENTLDMEEVLRYFVVHHFLVNGDSYTGNMIHNYYLHESDGKLGMIPWDYNLAFGTFMGDDASSSVNDSIDEVLSDRPMQAWIFSEETYTQQYHALFAAFIERWFSSGELEKRISDTAEMLRPYVEKDPTKFCTIEAFDAGVQTMQEFVTLRSEAVSRQLDGDTTAVEIGELNLSAMGSMGGNPSGGNLPQNVGRPSAHETGNAEEERPSMPLDMKPQGEISGGFVPSHSGGEGNPSDSRPTGNSFRPDDGASVDKPTESSELSQWGLVGLSVAVLAVGLLIALKKKA